MRFRRKAVSPTGDSSESGNGSGGNGVPAADGAGVDVDAFARAVDPTKLDEHQFVQLIDVLDMLGRAGTGIELARMRTDTFVWFVSRASTTQIEHLMAHRQLRKVVFDEIFRRMSEHIDRDKAATLRAVVHWRFTGGAGDGGYDRFQTVIDNGTCVSGNYPTSDPRVTLTLSPTDFLRAVTGSANVTMLFVRGRVKVKGDIPFAAGLINYFVLPRP